MPELKTILARDADQKLQLWAWMTPSELECRQSLISAMRDELDSWCGIAERGRPMPDVYQITLAREYMRCELYCVFIDRIAAHNPAQVRR